MTKTEKPAHVMVINDVPDLLTVLQEILEDEGYRVTVDTFSDFDLEAKYAHVAQVKPDALILDLIIGSELLGWQLLQRIKLDRTLAQMPIVICTAAAHQVEEIGAHLRTMGVAVILKPFDIDVLLKAVEQALHGGPQGGHSSADRSCQT
jgi:DNA-binding response OmpR family regulator